MTVGGLLAVLGIQCRQAAAAVEIDGEMREIKGLRVLRRDDGEARVVILVGSDLVTLAHDLKPGGD